MAVIVSAFLPNVAQPINHYVRGANGVHIQWTENIAEAQEFASGAAADTFMSGKWSLGYTKTTVNGNINYGQKSHT